SPYWTFQPGEGSRRPASISASASSSARRRDVSGASDTAGSSPSRRKGSPAQASARRAAASRPSASDTVVGCSLISCMNAALRRALHLSEKVDPANPQGGGRHRSISVVSSLEGSLRWVTSAGVNRLVEASSTSLYVGAEESSPR